MISRSDWEPLPIKASEFLRIPAKNRNGTEGTEIIGIPVPVTGTPGSVSRLDIWPAGRNGGSLLWGLDRDRARVESSSPARPSPARSRGRVPGGVMSYE